MMRNEIRLHGRVWECYACQPWSGWEYVPRPDGVTLREWGAVARERMAAFPVSRGIAYRVALLPRTGFEVQRLALCEEHADVLPGGGRFRQGADAL